MDSSLEKSAPAAATANRAYATHSDELVRPYVPGESPVERRQEAEGWRWLIGAGIGLAALLIYLRVWPALEVLLNRPSPVRDYLLPASADPIYVIGGVGVGWVWLLFIAAPLGALMFALLWWTALMWHNRRARAGHLGHLRPGQKWPGETYPGGPISVAGAAIVAAACGVILRWAGPAASTFVGGGLVVAVFSTAVWGWVQLVLWARARCEITRQINAVTYLASPMLGWTDLRAGRVRIVRCSYPRKEQPFPSQLKLLYGQHPRFIGDDLVRETREILVKLLSGRTYAIDHDQMTRTLTASWTEIVERDPAVTAEAVLSPLVHSWFDNSARVVSVTMAEPVIVIDEEGNLVNADEVDAEEASKSERTENDDIAERIKEFTVTFAYNTKVNTPYRLGMIEGAVAHSLGGTWVAGWSIASRRVRFRRCPGLPTMIDPPLEFPEVTRATIRELYKSAQIPFALDAYDNTIVWDFKQSPHMLVAGATSSGKTSLLMTIATQCARRGMNVVWVDPKGFDSPGMRSWPNVSLVTAGTGEDGLVGHTAALRYIADTMRERLAQVMINPNKADNFDPIVVITDEFSNLVVALQEFYKTYRSSKEKGLPPTTIDVGIILRTARAVGIHMAIGIQRPDTLFIAGEARDNTALRVALGRLRSKEAAQMMFNDSVAGTRVQPGIKGRGTVQLPDGSFSEIQAFYTPRVPATDEQRDALSDHERHILKILADVNSFWPRRVVDSALRGYDPEDPDEAAQMSFSVIRDSPIVLASSRPDLDQLSDEYVIPRGGVRKPTMDDDHEDFDPSETVEIKNPDGTRVTSSFGSDVDGYDDEYMPEVEDEYGPVLPTPSEEIQLGDLVDISVDGTGEWRYVHAEPYRSEDSDGEGRLVIPYRDLDSGQNTGDIDVDPYELMRVRQLKMM